MAPKATAAAVAGNDQADDPMGTQVANLSLDATGRVLQIMVSQVEGAARKLEVGSQEEVKDVVDRMVYYSAESAKPEIRQSLNQKRNTKTGTVLEGLALAGGLVVMGYLGYKGGGKAYSWAFGGGDSEEKPIEDQILDS